MRERAVILTCGATSPAATLCWGCTPRPRPLFRKVSQSSAAVGVILKSKPLLFVAPKSLLQNRLQFHLSHKVSSLSSLYSLSFLFSLLASLQFGDEKKLMVHHQALQNTIEDQVCQPLSALFLSSLSSLPHTAESSCHPLPQNALPRGH